MPDIEFVFNPRSIAVVGVSSNHDALTNRNFLRPLLELGYQGRIYPVNPHLSEIMGLKVYPSVLDIPEPVDSVVCAVPARSAPALMEECVRAKVKVVTLYTAGFGETGREEGLRLEKRLVEIARRGSVRIIGPNCLGIHCPEVGVTFEPSGARDGKAVGFLFQSGGNARDLILMGEQRGIDYSKGVSYGNACDLNETDFLEYFAFDRDTQAIAAYIEGLKEPRRFLRVLTKAAKEKPVLIVKGGRTGAGTRAVSLHTGALAGSRETWEALLRQTGAIQVRSLEQMSDDLLAFSYLRTPRGNRVGIVGIGGGAVILAADDCVYAGLDVPAFRPALVEDLRQFTPQAGTGLGNPIDTSADVYWDPPLFGKTVRVVADSGEVDIILVVLGLIYSARRLGGQQTHTEQIEAIVEACEGTDKPIAVVLRTGNTIEAEGVAFDLTKQCLKAGFPVFPSVARAAEAMAHLISCNASRGAGS